MFSGGVASWCAAKLVSDRYGIDNLILLFADTLIEDQDCYRFILEGAANIFNMRLNPRYIEKGFLNIPEIGDINRNTVLWRIANESRVIRANLDNGLVWLQEGNDVWDVFFEDKFLNHYVSNCSKKLKQKPCKGWLNWGLESQEPTVAKYLNNPENVTIYLGIDMNEIERAEKIIEGYKPFKVDFPLLWDNWLDRKGQFDLLESVNIQPPRLYKYGFSHNNCGGFCVKAGKKQFAQLLDTFPDRYNYHAQQEKAFQKHIKQEITILREQHNNEKTRLSLAEFKERPKQLSLFDAMGGCGCFID